MSNIKLQQANHNLLAPYADYLQYAVTLTIKTATTISTVLSNDYPFERAVYLTEDTLNSTIRYFTSNLTYYLYGNAARHKNKQHHAKPLLFFVVEGLNSYQHTHLHLALGNVPDHKKDNIDTIIQNAWAQCDFANTQIKVKPIYDAAGWTSYITKEVGFANNDALYIAHCVIPKVYQN